MHVRSGQERERRRDRTLRAAGLQEETSKRIMKLQGFYICK